MRHQKYVALLLVFVSLLIFFPVIGFEFQLCDDNLNVYRNPQVLQFSLANLLHFWQGPHEGLYIPITYDLWTGLAGISSLMPLAANGTINPLPFHLANLVLHLAAAGVVLAVCRRLVRDEWAAGFGAMVFACHPLQVEAVAWVTGMKDVLSGLLALLCLWCYLLAIQPQGTDDGGQRRWHYALATGFFLLALLAKPGTVVVPLLAAVMGLWVTGRGNWRRLTRDLLPWLLLTLPIIMVTRSAQPEALTGFLPDIGQRLLIAGDALSFYLTKLAWPWALAFDYGRTPKFVLTHDFIWITGLLPYATGLVLLWKGRPPWLFAASAIFVVSLLPVSGLIPFSFQETSTVADRYLYLAMLGPALGVSSWLAGQRAPFVRAGMGLVLALLCLASMTQIRHWQNPFTLNSHTLEVNPQSWKANNDLASISIEQHDTTTALAFLKKTVALRPEYPNPYANLGVIYSQTKDWQSAIAAYRKALELQPTFAGAYINLGTIYYDTGKTDEAEACWKKAIALTPGLAAPYNNLGLLYAQSNRLDEAIPLLLKSIEINPKQPKTYNYLGRAYLEAGNDQQALAALQQAITLDPGLAVVYNNLSIVYLHLQQYRQAVENFDKAQQLGFIDEAQGNALEPYRQ